MAKPKKQIKRTVAKSGEVRYFYGGRRIKEAKGRKLYVKANYNTFQHREETGRNPKFVPKPTSAELKTFHRAKAQRSLDRFRGRPVPKSFSYVMRQVLKSVGPEPVDFSKLINPATGKPVYPRYSSLLKVVQDAGQYLDFSVQTSQGLPGFRGRTALTSVTDIVEKFSEPGLDRLKIWVLLPEFLGGGQIEGRARGFDAIRSFETTVIESVMEARQNVAFVKFEYYPEYDFVNGVVKFDLRVKEGWDAVKNARDFADVQYYNVTVDVMYSDPIKKTD